MRNQNLKNKTPNTENKIPNTKESKGITLIALILTIIVLLILAVVAISAVNDGGIIQHAQNAKTEYEKAQEKEEILLAQSEWTLSKYTNPGQVFKTFMESKLGDKATSVVGSDNGPLTVTMKSGKQYTITDSGNIVEGWLDNGDGSFTKGEETIKIGETTYTTEEVLEKLGIAPSAGKYNGNWVVIGVEGDKLKLVSEGNVGSNVTLGKDDPNAPEVLEEIFDKEGETTNLDLEKAIWSYNNAVDTLDTAAKTATGIASASSITIEDIYDIIGEENVDKGAQYGKVIRYSFSGEYVYSKEVTGTDDESNPGKSTNKKSLIFVKDGRTVIIDKENSKNVVDLTCNSFSYTLSEPQKSAIGSLATGEYWLASQSVFCRDNWNLSPTSFSVRVVLSGIISNISLFRPDGNAISSGNRGVRAVVYI